MDLYIASARANGAVSGSEKSRQDFIDRLNKLEAEVNPLHAICQRGQGMLAEEEAWLAEVQKNFDAGMFKINPYDSKAWKISAFKNASELCCSIKNDPEWQREILDRIEQGWPPLSGEPRSARPQKLKKWPGKEVIVKDAAAVPEVKAEKDGVRGQRRGGRGRRGGGGGRNGSRGKGGQ